MATAKQQETTASQSSVAEAKPTVIEALSAVMEEVQSVKKADRNQIQNYSFRGIDAVVNAVGPALRKHGVVVVPTGATCEAEHYTTAKGAAMRGVTLTVTFRFYGPAGDFIDAAACGEASDSGDKAIPKAHSVAYRTLLLQALCIPTDEPDPDASSYERAASNGRPARTPEPAVTAAAAKELDALIDTLNATGVLTEVQIRDGMQQSYGTSVTEQLTKSQAENLKARLEAKATVTA